MRRVRVGGFMRPINTICITYYRVSLPYHRIYNPIVSQIKYVLIFLRNVLYFKISITYRKIFENYVGNYIAREENS